MLTPPEISLTEPEIEKAEWWRPLLAIGPGIVFVLSSTGPRDLVSNSIAGSTVGTSLVWVLVASVIGRFVLLDASARYVLVTGDSLLGGVGKAGKWAAWLWFVATVFRRHAQALVRLVLLGTAAHFIFPLPTAHSVAIWGVSSWLLGFVVSFWGRYEGTERLSKVMALLLGICLVAAAVLSRPNVWELVEGVFHPAMPQEKGVHSPAIILITIISGAVGGFGNLKYSAYVHEKGWRSLKDLQKQRWDLGLSMVGMFVMLVLIQVAAAGALKPLGLQVKKVEDLIPIFSQVIGGGGAVVLGVLLWGIVFSSHVTSTSGNAIMLSDVWHRFIWPQAGFESQTNIAAEAPTKRPFYRWAVVYMCLSPLYVFATDWTPVGLVIAYGVISIVALPVISALVLWLTANRRVMGEYTNGWITNSVLVLMVLSALYLGWEGVGALMEDIKPGG